MHFDANPSRYWWEKKKLKDLQFISQHVPCGSDGVRGLTLIKKSWLWYWYSDSFCNKIIVSAHISERLKLMTILSEVWRFWHGHCGLWGISVIPLNCRKGVWVVVHSWCCVDSVVHSVCALIVIFQCCILVYCWPYHVGHSREGLNATVIEYGRHAGIHHTLYAKLFSILHFCAVTFFTVLHHDIRRYIPVLQVYSCVCWHLM